MEAMLTGRAFRSAAGMSAVALMLHMTAPAADAAIITLVDRPYIGVNISSYITFNDGRPPVVAGENKAASDSFGPENPAPAVWRESVNAYSEARSGDLFHSTSGSASLDRRWVTPSLLTISGRVAAAWEDTVPDVAPAPRGYSIGSVDARYLL
jgi:hypothetical protein